jgi:hypothetical protein
MWRGKITHRQVTNFQTVVVTNLRYLLLRWKPPPGKIASRVSKNLNIAVTKIATVVVTAVRAQIIVIDPPSLVVSFLRPPDLPPSLGLDLGAASASASMAALPLKAGRPALGAARRIGLIFQDVTVVSAVLQR